MSLLCGGCCGFWTLLGVLLLERESPKTARKGLFTCHMQICLAQADQALHPSSATIKEPARYIVH